MLLLIFCFAMVIWPDAAPTTQAAAQSMAQRNVLPVAAGGRAGSTSALVNGRTFSNTRVMGQVLVLDVGSLHLIEAATPGTEAAAAAAANPEDSAAASVYIKSVLECSLHCALLPGCNAFSYCSTTTGCGAGCAEWAAQHPPVNATGEVKGDASSYWTKLPITGFGPFLPKGSSGCHPGGGWPYGMCSLATVDSAADADVYAQGAAGAGWVSGVFTLPSKCTGMSARACESCGGSANLTGCLACVNSTQQDAASLAIRGIPNLRQPQDGCHSCYNSRSPDSCMDCLRNSSLPCHRCPAEAISPNADMDTCIPCVQQHGPALTSSCISCAQSSEPQQCTACLNNAAKNFCPDVPDASSNPADVSASDDAGSQQCIGTTSPVCRLCVERSNQKDMCLACASADRYSADCEYCALEADPAAAAACYNCSTSLQGSNSTSQAYCSGCLSLTDAEDKQQCLECLASAAVSSSAKQWCLGCASASNKARCFECLKQRLENTDAYRARCLMSRSADGTPSIAVNFTAASG